MTAHHMPIPLMPGLFVREAQKCPYILKFRDFCAIIIYRQRKLLAFKTMKPFRRSLQFSLH